MRPLCSQTCLLKEFEVLQFTLLLRGFVVDCSAYRLRETFCAKVERAGYSHWPQEPETGWLPLEPGSAAGEAKYRTSLRDHILNPKTHT